MSARCRSRSASTEREFFIDNLLVRIRFIIVMMRWTGLAPWEFDFPFPIGRAHAAALGAPGALQGYGIEWDVNPNPHKPYPADPKPSTLNPKPGPWNPRPERRALLTSGNCLELLYTKSVVRWGWIVGLAALTGIVGAPLAASNTAWGAGEVARVTLPVVGAIGAVLPLV